MSKADTHILVVEDDPDQRGLIVGILQDEGYRVSAASSAEEALSIVHESVRESTVDLVFSDWKLPKKHGLDILQEIRDTQPDTGFILATAYSSIAHAITTIRAGADDYLPKPFERDSLLFCVDKVVKNRELVRQNKALQESAADRDRLVRMIGRSLCMQTLFRKVEKLAETEATILISGESGTGKELAARALYELSNRKDRVFLPVNCAAIPDAMAEAELFGIEKDTLHGSPVVRVGKLEAASQGTLFLDEVAELPLPIQGKLLRFLQSGVIQRVGSTREIALNVRIIASTHANLAHEVAEGRFREDLFYRLSVIPLQMPALSERREDIPHLVKHFAELAARKNGVRLPKFSGELMQKLMDAPWRGHVRELGNAVERLVLLAENEMLEAADAEFLETEIGANGDDLRLPASGLNWEHHEKNFLRQALRMADNNRSQAAKLLQLPYKAFLYRLEKHGL